MKIIIVGLLLVQSMLGYSQKIKNVEIDKFTGKKRIQTDYVKLGGYLMSGIGASFRTVDTTIYITFTGSYGLGVVGTSDETLFLFSDKSTFGVFPTSIQSYEISSQGNYYEQKYYISKSQMETLSKNNPISLRRNYSNNYIDLDIKSKFSLKISELASMVLNELNKNSL